MSTDKAYSYYKGGTLLYTDVTWVLSTDKAHSYYKGDTILYTDVTWVLSTDKTHSYYKGGTILYTDVTWVLSTDKTHSYYKGDTIHLMVGNWKATKNPHCLNNSKMKYQNRKRSKIDICNTHIIHDHSPSWLGTGTSIKSGEIKLVLRYQVSLLRSAFHKWIKWQHSHITGWTALK